MYQTKTSHCEGEFALFAFHWPVPGRGEQERECGDGVVGVLILGFWRILILGKVGKVLVIGQD